MERRTIRFRPGLAGLIGLLALTLLSARSEAQYIPRQRVPETPEPGLADPRELPKNPPETLLPGMPRGTQPFPGVPRPGIPEPVAALPPAADPPTPSVSIRVRAPASVGISAKEVNYSIVVENTSRAPAHHVQVTNPIPQHARFIKAEPTPKDPAAPTLRWDLGTLGPGVSREISLTLQPTGDGDITDVARVQFEYGQQVMTVVNRPALSLKRVAPKYAHENDSIPVKLIVENTSRVEVRNIVVTDAVDEGLEHAGPDKSALLKREWTIESLAAGQKRELDFALQANKQGVFTSRTAAHADFLPEIKADSWTVTVGKALLDVKVAGPVKPIYLSQPARYDIVARNQGTIPMDNVAVAFSLPLGMKVKQASQGAEQFSSRVQWVIQKFNPGESRTFSLQVQAAEPGTVPLFVEALGRGHVAHAEIKTEFVGAAALRLRIHKSSDPIVVGDKVTYTVTVQNTGTAEARDVEVKISVPTVQLKVESTTAGLTATKDQSSFAWGPLRVRPGQTQTITVPAEATAAGKVRIHAEMTAPDLTSGPLTWEEETTIVDKSK
jgi:uncharacterized repeat protein (TIGR01451 family)